MVPVDRDERRQRRRATGARAVFSPCLTDCFVAGRLGGLRVCGRPGLLSWVVCGLLRVSIDASDGVDGVDGVVTVGTTESVVVG